MKITIYINQKYLATLYEFLDENNNYEIMLDCGSLLQNKWGLEKTEDHNIQVILSYWEFIRLQDNEKTTA